MSRIIETDDKRVLMIGDVAINHQQKGNLGDTILGVTTFVCDHCDRTHVVIQCQDMDEQFNMALEAKDAERLAHMLLNPRPYQPIKDQ